MNKTGKLPEPFKRGKYYYFTIRQNGKRINKSTGRVRKKDAYEFIENYLQAKNRGRTEKSFGEYAAPFFSWDSCPHVKRLWSNAEDPENKPPISKKYVYDSCNWMKRWILTDRIFPELVLREISRGDIEDLKIRLLERSPSRRTAQAALKTVKVVLAEAYHRQDIAENPGENVSLPKVKGKPRSVLHPSELRILLLNVLTEAEEPLHRTFLSFLILTGGRVTEARMIKWKDIDFTTRELFLQRNVKWHKSRRIILPSLLIDRLQYYKSRALFTEPDDLVFAAPWRDGKQPGSTWVKKHFQKMITASQNISIEAGKIEPGERHFTPHCLRKSMNMLLLSERAPALDVIAYLGWSDEATEHLAEAQKYYTEMQLLDTSRIAEIIDRTLGIETNDNKVAI